METKSKYFYVRFEKYELLKWDVFVYRPINDQKKKYIYIFRLKVRKLFVFVSQRRRAYQ